MRSCFLVLNACMSEAIWWYASNSTRPITFLIQQSLDRPMFVILLALCCARYPDPTTDDCPFAHTVLEVMYHPNMYKTALCQGFVDDEPAS